MLPLLRAGNYKEEGIAIYYLWTDLHTKKTFEVERKVKDIDVHPKWSEIKLKDMTWPEYTKATWVRVLLGGSFTKGFSGPGQGKGYW